MTDSICRDCTYCKFTVNNNIKKLTNQKWNCSHEAKQQQDLLCFNFGETRGQRWTLLNSWRCIQGNCLTDWQLTVTLISGEGARAFSVWCQQLWLCRSQYLLTKFLLRLSSLLIFQPFVCLSAAGLLNMYRMDRAQLLNSTVQPILVSSGEQQLLHYTVEKDELLLESHA